MSRTWAVAVLMLVVALGLQGCLGPKYHLRQGCSAKVSNMVGPEEVKAKSDLDTICSDADHVVACARCGEKVIRRMAYYLHGEITKHCVNFTTQVRKDELNDDDLNASTIDWGNVWMQQNGTIWRKRAIWMLNLTSHFAPHYNDSTNCTSTLNFSTHMDQHHKENPAPWLDEGENLYETFGGDSLHNLDSKVDRMGIMLIGSSFLVALSVGAWIRASRSTRRVAAQRALVAGEDDSSYELANNAEA